MAGGEDGGEKTHEPTPRKLEDARRKGEVAKSADVGVAAIYIAMLATVGAFGGSAAVGAGSVLAGFVENADQLQGKVLGPGGALLSARAVGQAVAPALPLLLAPFVAAVLAYAAQMAIVFAPSKLAPKLSRIDPIANAGNKFGPTGLAEFAKSTVKLVAISIILALFMAAEADRIVALVRADPLAIGPEMVRVGVALLATIAAVAVMIAAADLLWQRFDHARKHRMSFQELKEEMKESEGDPHLKGERRRRAEKIASNRMMAEVPKADVVIVNPTHVAVALKWSRRPGSAPECVAKGEDAVALAIREKAQEAGVPIHHDPPTARALLATVEIGEEVAPEHYKAVAAAIRYAEKMRALAREKGWG
ncbi:flagellar type III secretion system protein FlhB [Albimonas sp. CAU 1670]|uniref:EscU/YscU/HrcU family type III secretion system export apparatus switch protein n=1 Tax=Albimonas sp. CAU 1670 TaxID=3032599 RepID=UPI0023DC7D8A|nr:flagellar type III secretion system protein FlhB [Albimonas sp. CAU 1670]MDF2233504.1 flagellar type III secretion system protein FlhB [Albimonas sp. CAU 1670]